MKTYWRTQIAVLGMAVLALLDLAPAHAQSEELILAASETTVTLTQGETILIPIANPTDTTLMRVGYSSSPGSPASFLSLGLPIFLVLPAGATLLGDFRLTARPQFGPGPILTPPGVYEFGVRAFGDPNSIGTPFPRSTLLSFTVTVTPIPEPGTLALFGTGALGLLGYRWRRRRAA